MSTQSLFEDDLWPYVVTLLPPNLDESARSDEALLRCRNVADAATLVRLALAYAVSDLSYKDTAAWAKASGVAKITGPGLFYRLRVAKKWLQSLLAHALASEAGAAPPGLRLRIVDATVLIGPGATGTQWRAHVLIDPATGGIQSVEITDASGGEGYARHAVEPGDIIVGDRGYAAARGMASVIERGAHVIARLNPHAIRLCDKDKQVVSLLDETHKIPKTGVVTWNLLMPVPPERKTASHRTWKLADALAWIPVRVLAARNRQGHAFWIVTTLAESEMGALRAMEVYRLRWQIELCFKRLKSLLHLDALPSKQGPTAQSWMLSRFLAAALAQKLVEPAGSLSPWGYVLHEAKLST